MITQTNNSIEVASILPEQAGRLQARGQKVAGRPPLTGQVSVGIFDDIVTPESMAGLREWAARQLANDSIGEAILRVNSPGGFVAGVPETYEFLRRLASKKTLTVVAEEYLCSAAYWFASAATKIVASPSCYVGSCGVVSLLIDDSEAMAASGVRVIPVATSEGKLEGIPGMPVDAAMIARVQRRVNDTRNMFVRDLRRAGRMTAQQREDAFESADIWRGREAVKRGLVDSIAIPEDIFTKHAEKTRQTQFAHLQGEEADAKFERLVMQADGVAHFWDTTDAAENKIRQQYPTLAENRDRFLRSYH